MITYILRRLLTAFLVLLGTSFVVYVLLTFSGDPLGDLRVSSDPNREKLIADRIALLNLDVNPVQRYFMWLGGAAGCVVPGMACDLGNAVSGQPVTEALGLAIVQTLRMVTLATFTGMILGILLGMITALRQYSLFDYGATFFAFLCFSLPVFWLAVLLKEFGAIKFNDFLADPVTSIPTSIIIGLVIGLLVAGGVGGTRKNQLIWLGSSLVFVVVLVQVLSATRWLERPSLGIAGIVILGTGFAFAFTTVIAGLRNRRALYSSLAMVVLGAIIYLPIQPLLDRATSLMIFILAVVTVAVGILAGHFAGGYDRGQNRGAAALTAFMVAGIIFIDKFMLHWAEYVAHPRIKGRPIATLGAATPNFSGNYWMEGLDAFTHVILPTSSLVLMGFAGWMRYTRATMLEVMSQDYVRTARAKGLTERVVTVKHAFRNALVPIATLVAMAIGGIVGGAIISEKIFSWSGMGTLFFKGLTTVDPNPVMAVFLVSSSMTMLFIILADISYAFLDPRVRVK